MENLIIEGLTNEEIVGRCIQVLRSSLIKYIEKRMYEEFGEKYLDEINAAIEFEELYSNKNKKRDKNGGVDIACILSMLERGKTTLYKELLNIKEYMFEIRQTRNAWAHLSTFDDSKTFRSIDCVEKIIEATCFNENSEELLTIKQVKKLFILRMAKNVVEEEKKIQQNVNVYHSPFNSSNHNTQNPFQTNNYLNQQHME